MTTPLDALERVIEQVVAPNAAAVDQDGAFPTASIDALRTDGFLGLTSSADVGGAGLGMAEAATVIEQLASACGSTAMVTLMHYAAVSVLEAHGDEAIRREVAGGNHLTTLAFSEQGSRSHFWSPIGTATATDGGVQLDASKSWVTAAAQADSYVWSSRPLAGDGPMTLWTVDPKAAGVTVGSTFDGLGLRGNGSVPVKADGVVVAAGAQLGEDGAGLDIALTSALPWFLVLNSAFSLGLMEAATAETGRHASATRFEDLGESLVYQPVVRADYATMRLRTDSVRAFLADTLGALGSGRADGTLRVLESKALAAETALDVTDLAMKVCGGAAFRKELGIERRFRDARAAQVMAPTTDALLDFIGRAISGLPLLGPLP